MNFRRILFWEWIHHLVGGVIVLSWVVVMGKQLMPGSGNSIDLLTIHPPSLSESSHYYAVYYENQKIGFAEAARLPGENGKTRFLDRAYWQFKVQGQPQKMAIETAATVSQNWDLEHFKMRIDGGYTSISVEGTISDSILDLSLVTAGKTIRESLPLEQPLFLPGMIRAYVSEQELYKGKTFSAAIYNPIVRSTENMNIIVEGRDEWGWKISEVLRGSMKTTYWMNEAREVIRELSPLGFRLEAQEKEKAVVVPKGSAPDLVFAVSISTEKKIEKPSKSRGLSVLLRGVNPSSYKDLDGSRQTLQGMKLNISVPQFPTRAGYQLPFRNGDGSVSPEYLASTPLVQVDDPHVRNMAAKIVKKRLDPLPVIQDLFQWVFREIRKLPSVGVPSALDVLITRAGDCNEHTVLFTALARAAGIPTRMAAGIVYVEALGGKEGFFYHAWPEVWVDQDWVALDPTLGQLPADATHIRFISGGLNRQIDLLSLIGSLGVKVLSVDYQEQERQNEDSRLEVEL